jgi:hypothetical protein
MKRSPRRIAVAFGLTALAAGFGAIPLADAQAQSYPFEGRWYQPDGSTCEYADVYSRRQVVYTGDAENSCSVQKVIGSGDRFELDLSCKDPAGHSSRYRARETITMLGNDRMRVKNSKMDGQTTLYARCR